MLNHVSEQWRESKLNAKVAESYQSEKTEFVPIPGLMIESGEMFMKSLKVGLKGVFMSETLRDMREAAELTREHKTLWLQSEGQESGRPPDVLGEWSFWLE